MTDNTPKNRELSPCPFCFGAKGNPMLEKLIPEVGYDWRIRCYGCGVEVAPTMFMNGDEAKNEVIKVWNTRADKQHYKSMAIEAVENECDYG